MDYPSNPNIRLLNGKFTDGDPAQNIPASLDPASHLNALTDELLAVIAAAGLVPDENTLTQVRDALNKLFVRGTFAETHKLTRDATTGALMLEEL
ncbi:MAG: hypothetical protein AB1450_13150 [Pseudomonadota bacterium]